MTAAHYDLVLRGGMVYDGSGVEPVEADVAIRGDRIAAIGPTLPGAGAREIDVAGHAVAPGFINVMSWAIESLIIDPRSQSDIRQGVTLEIFGEGGVGPINAAMRAELEGRQKDVRYSIEWSSLGGFLEYLARRGVAPNVASFVSHSMVRQHELGYSDRSPTSEERDRMRAHVRHAMEEGAIGLAAALIYTPDCWATTDDLIELANVAGGYGGAYISHLRSEGERFVEAVEEMFRIASTANCPAEIYHLKAGGRANWHKMDTVLAMVEDARAQGMAITANMYTYPAGATGLDASMPVWAQAGGREAWIARLRNPETRARIREEMKTPGDDWENLRYAAASENVRLIGFRNDALKPLIGMTLAEVAATRGTSPEDTAMDLVIEDDSRVECVYFLMSEQNIRKQIARPWVSFGSDAAAIAPEGIFLNGSTHPRTYGNVARLLARYVRDEQIISLAEAVRRLTSLPAANFKLRGLGLLLPGYFADVVVFDPASVQDQATFDAPHRYATGVSHVFVNGVAVLDDGEHTGATPGRVVRGPGWPGHAA